MPTMSYFPLYRTVRRLVASPSFTLTAVLTLSLGLAATTAISSLIHGVLLKPLPYPEPGQLVGVWYSAPGLGFDQVNQSAATFLTIREEGQVFEDMALWDQETAAVTGIEEPEEVAALGVTHGFFPLLRQVPHLGRLFTAEDDSPENPETVVLSHGFWQRRFSGSPGVLGQTLRVGGRLREIIGVAPDGFRFLDNDAALFLPIRIDRSEVVVGQFNYQGVARLKPGRTLDEANADVDRLVPVSVEKFPGGITLAMLDQARFAADVHPLKEDLVGELGSVLWVLLGSVGLVLVIAVANVANLFLVRAEARQPEMALRAALGATRRNLALHYLAESVVLGLLAGVLGLGIAALAVRALVTFGPRRLPRLQEVGFDPPVLAVTLLVSVLSGLLFGFFPVLRLGFLRLVEALKDGGRGAGTGRQRHRLRAGLVVVQVALALVLVVAAGLLMRSFRELLDLDPGFRAPGEVLTFRVGMPTAEVETPLEVVQAFEEVFRAVTAVPGVTSVGAVSALPMEGYDSNDALFVEDFPTEEGQLPPIRRFKFVTGGYFSTLGHRLLAGRAIDWQDIHGQRAVAVITESLAREYWGTPASALGRRVATLDIGEDGGGAIRLGPWREIVGVVNDVYDVGLTEPPPSMVFWPMSMERFWGDELYAHRSLAFVLRTAVRDPSSLLEPVRNAVWSINGNLPLARVFTLQEIYDRSLTRTRFTLLLSSIAAGVALLLGTIGIYGVIAYIVSQRTREIGVRIALGARHQDVSSMMVRHGLLLGSLGLALGLAGAAGLARALRAVLFGVSTMDWATYAAATMVLAAVILGASYLAARRAANVDPLLALRIE